MARDRPARRPWTGVIVTLLGVTAAASVVLGAQGIMAYAESNEEPPVPAVFTTALEKGTVTQQVSGDIVVEPEFEWVIERQQADNAQPIITRPGLTAGKTVNAGTVLATVAERPVIVLAGSVPSYRALGPGSTGPDVTQLQNALTAFEYDIWDAAGNYGPATAIAVYNMYLAMEYQPITSEGEPVTIAAAETTGIPFGEIRFLQALPAMVENTCGNQGDTAADTLCTLTGGTPTMLVTIPAIDAGPLAQDQAVLVTLADGTELLGTLGQRREMPTAAPAPSTDSDSEQPGSGANPGTGTATAPDTVSFNVIPIETNAAMKPGQTGTASITVIQSPPDSLRVEGTAVRTDTNGTTWLEKPDATRLDITVGLCSGGFCSVEGAGIKQGIEVTLPLPGVDQGT